MVKVTVLSKEMFDRDKLWDLMNSVYFNNIFLNQIAKLFKKSPYTMLVSDDTVFSKVLCYGPRDEFSNHSIENQFSINPCIVNYNDVKEDCTVIGEDNDKLLVRYGTYPTGMINDFISFLDLKKKYEKGELIKTFCEIPILVKFDGKIEKASKYRDLETNKEYVFISGKDGERNYSIEDITMEDIENNNGTVGVVSPIEWVVDKKTKIMISKFSLFLAEVVPNYQESFLKKYLDSNEFFKDISVTYKEKDANKKYFKDELVEMLDYSYLIPYVYGAHGIGKTSIIKNINKNVLSFSVSSFTPELFAGITGVLPNGSIGVIEPDWYKKTVAMAEKCKKNDESCLLFFDDFDKLDPNMYSFMSGITDTPRMIANLVIPDNVSIVLAGNKEMLNDQVIESRIIKIKAVPDIKEWLNWADSNDIDPIIKSYLNINNGDFLNFKISDERIDYIKKLNPRSWSQKINSAIHIARQTNDYSLIKTYMDDDSYSKFKKFTDEYFRLNIDDMINGNFQNINVLKYSDEELFVIINSLAAIVNTKEKMINTLEFLKKIESKYTMIFISIWTSIHNKKDDIIKLEEKNFVKRR